MYNAPNARRWRKKSKRGVSPIIATILLVAITVVLAAVLYILISGLTKGPGNTPIGTALALGQIKEAQKGTNNWYNVSIASAGGGLTLSNMVFQVQGSGGGVVTLASPTVTVVGLAGTTIATFTMSSGTWASGGSTTASNQQTIVILTTTNLVGQGDSLLVYGSGSFSGSVSTSIP